MLRATLTDVVRPKGKLAYAPVVPGVIVKVVPSPRGTVRRGHPAVTSLFSRAPFLLAGPVAVPRACPQVRAKLGEGALGTNGTEVTIALGIRIDVSGRVLGHDVSHVLVFLRTFLVLPHLELHLRGIQIR